MISMELRLVTGLEAAAPVLAPDNAEENRARAWCVLRALAAAFCDGDGGPVGPRSEALESLFPASASASASASAVTLEDIINECALWRAALATAAAEAALARASAAAAAPL